MRIKFVFAYDINDDFTVLSVGEIPGHLSYDQLSAVTRSIILVDGAIYGFTGQYVNDTFDGHIVRFDVGGWTRVGSVREEVDKWLW